MLWVLLLIIALISYGSLYPFNFTDPPGGASWVHLVHGMAIGGSSRGDILQNIVLFVPYGACAMLGFGTRWPLAARIGGAAMAGLALAVALQVGQVFLPQRTASLVDVAWNAIGIGLGMAAGLVAVRIVGPDRLARAGDGRPAPAIVPAALIGLWVALRLFPFVPSIDFQLIKDNLKPLLLRPDLSPFGLFENTVGWLLALSLWRDVSGDRRNDALALPAIAGVLAVQPVIVGNPLRAYEVVGALLAVALWRWWLAGRPRREEAIATLLFCLLLLQGLTPLAFRAEPAAFGWIPFIGALGGSIMANVLAMMDKVFFYGVAIWMLAACGAHRLAAALVVAVLLFAIELAQTLIATRTPEITDPLLALILGLAFWLVSPAGTAATRPHPAHGGLRSPLADRRGAGTGWRTGRDSNPRSPVKSSAD